MPDQPSRRAVNYCGPVRAITLTYTTPVPLTSDQMQVALSNFTFRQPGC